MRLVWTHHGHCSHQHGWQGLLVVTALARGLASHPAAGKGDMPGVQAAPEPPTAPVPVSACTHGRAERCQTRHSPAARRGRGQRGTGWQQLAPCPGRAVCHWRQTQPVPPSTTHTADGSAARGASKRPCTAPGYTGPRDTGPMRSCLQSLPHRASCPRTGQQQSIVCLPSHCSGSTEQSSPSHGCFQHRLHNSLRRCQQPPSSDCSVFPLVTVVCPSPHDLPEQHRGRHLLPWSGPQGATG